MNWDNVICINQSVESKINKSFVGSKVNLQQLPRYNLTQVSWEGQSIHSVKFAKMYVEGMYHEAKLVLPKKVGKMTRPFYSFS